MRIHTSKSSALATVVQMAGCLAIIAGMTAVLFSRSARHVGAQSTPSESSQSYEEFIDAVWAFESDIDPAEQDYYNKNWNKPVVKGYPKVEYPGRVIRDKNGNPEMDHDLTVEEFFNVIGIGHLYSPSDPTPDWKLIQSNVTNYLGFVGFQFQSSDLVDTGYYEFTQKIVRGKPYPMHYIDLPNSTWADGRRSILVYPPKASEPTLATDTVVWFNDNFTGKNGINSYEDFTTPDKHILVIKDHFANKYNGIVTELKARGKSLGDYLGTYVYWNELDPPVAPPPGGRSNKVEITMSGLLAGAHLRGAAGVVELLVDHRDPADENGTYILQYVQDYAGYDTPFGTDPAPRLPR